LCLLSVLPLFPAAHRLGSKKVSELVKTKLPQNQQPVASSALAPKHALHDGAALKNLTDEQLFPAVLGDPVRHKDLAQDLKEFLMNTLQYDRRTRWTMLDVMNSALYQRAVYLRLLMSCWKEDLVKESNARRRAASNMPTS
jgi:hypothetical protein